MYGFAVPPSPLNLSAKRKKGFDFLPYLFKNPCLYPMISIFDQKIYFYFQAVHQPVVKVNICLEHVMEQALVTQFHVKVSIKCRSSNSLN